jgi:hypothetical protein
MSDHENNPSDALTTTTAIPLQDEPSTPPHRTVEGLTFSGAERSDVEDSPERDINLDDFPVFGSVLRDVGPDHAITLGRENGRPPFL